MKFISKQNKKFTSRKNKLTKKYHKKHIQKGGDIGEFRSELKHRLNFFSNKFNYTPENLQAEVESCISNYKEIYSMNNPIIPPRVLPDGTIKHYQKQETKVDEIYSKSKVIITQVNTDLADPAYIQTNTYIAYYHLHGSTINFEDDISKNIVPPKTIICFIPRMDNLISYDNRIDGESYLHRINNLKPEEYNSLFQQRENLSSLNKPTFDNLDLYINCFKDSVWYYEGQIYPNLILSCTAKDFDTSNSNYIPNAFSFNFYEYDSTRTHIVRKDTGEPEFPNHRELGERVKIGKIFITELDKWVHYHRPGKSDSYKLIIVSSCRPIYEEPQIKKSLLQYELVHYHINQDIIKQFVPPTPEYGITFKLKCNIVSTKQYHHEFTEIYYYNRSDTNRNDNYSGVIPTLMDIHNTIEGHRSMNMEDENYLANLSMKKILLFINKIHQNVKINFLDFIKIIGSQFLFKKMVRLLNLADKTQYSNSNFHISEIEIIDVIRNLDNIADIMLPIIGYTDVYLYNSLYKNKIISEQFLERIGNKEIFYYKHDNKIPNTELSPVSEIKIDFHRFIIDCLEKFSKVKTLSFNKDNVFLYSETKRQYDNIETLNIRNFELIKDGIYMRNNISTLSDYFRNVKVINCQSMDFLSGRIINQKFTQLKTLKVNNFISKNNYYIFNFITLENLSINRGNIDRIDLNASRLINLDLQDLYDLTELKLTCPRLNKIELIYYEHLNKLNITGIGNLHNLNITGGSFVEDKLEFDGRIKLLYFKNCTFTPYIFLKFIEKLTSQVEKIILSGNTSIQDSTSDFKADLLLKKKQDKIIVTGPLNYY